MGLENNEVREVTLRGLEQRWIKQRYVVTEE